LCASVGTIKSALVLLMHDANMKAVLPLQFLNYIWVIPVSNIVPVFGYSACDSSWHPFVPSDKYHESTSYLDK